METLSTWCDQVIKVLKKRTDISVVYIEDVVTHVRKFILFATGLDRAIEHPRISFTRDSLYFTFGRINRFTIQSHGGKITYHMDTASFKRSVTGNHLVGLMQFLTKVLTIK